MRLEKDQDILLMKLIKSEFSKFIVVGIINTAITYIVYIALLGLLGYNNSYLISYILGILISYALNTKFVFNTNYSVIKLIKFPLVYIAQYLINAMVLRVVIERDITNELFAPILVLILSIPVTFLLSKTILKGKQ
jgi:putative flippase GtrA